MSILFYLKHPSEYILQRDGENQWLRRLATLPRGQSFFFPWHSHWVADNYLKLQFLGMRHPLLASTGIFIHGHIPTYMHIITKIKTGLQSFVQRQPNV